MKDVKRHYEITFSSPNPNVYYMWLHLWQNCASCKPTVWCIKWQCMEAWTWAHILLSYTYKEILRTVVDGIDECKVL